MDTAETHCRAKVIYSLKLKHNIWEVKNPENTIICVCCCCNLCSAHEFIPHGCDWWIYRDLREFKCSCGHTGNTRCCKRTNCSTMRYISWNIHPKDLSWNSD